MCPFWPLGLYQRRAPTCYRPAKAAALLASGCCALSSHSSHGALVQSTAASFGGGKGCGFPGIHGRRRGCGISGSGPTPRLVHTRPRPPPPRPAVADSLRPRKRPPTLPSARLPPLTAFSGPLNCHFLARGGCGGSLLGPGPPGGQHAPPRHLRDWRSFPESSVQRCAPISSAMGPARLLGRRQDAPRGRRRRRTDAHARVSAAAPPCAVCM